MISTYLLPILSTLAPLGVSAAPFGEVSITWEAPRAFLAGTSFPVHIEVSVPEDGATMPSWVLSPAAFAVNGTPVAERVDDSVLTLPPNARLSLDYDLGKYLSGKQSFKLHFAETYAEQKPVSVTVYREAPKNTNFMELPATDLADYNVVLETNQGSIQLEFWPDVAPGHVRNFLDLSHAGFYDGTIFHRVQRNFMIQGGDPNGDGTGGGPRRLPAEFSDRKHLRGVLSMARSADENSASSQFFICHADSLFLDRRYTAFGEVVLGMDTVDKIATTKVGGREKETPVEKQVILRATVVLAAEGSN